MKKHLAFRKNLSKTIIPSLLILNLALAEEMGCPVLKLIAATESSGGTDAWEASHKRLADLVNGGEDLQKSHESYVHGSYATREEAETKITESALSNQDVNSAQFIDAVRILFLSEASHHFDNQEQLTPIGGVILREISRRPDEATPILIKLMDREKDNPYCGIQSAILGGIGAIKTIDP